MLTVREAPGATDAIVGLLRSAVSGAEGGIRIRDDAPDVERVHDATWLTAWRGERLVGAYALVPRPWGWWRCHFAVHPDEDPAVVGALLVNEAKARLLERARADQIIAGSHDDSNHVLKGLLADAGYRSVRRFDLFVYARRRDDPSVGLVETKELVEVQRKLEARGLHWSDAAGLRADRYWVLRDEAGRILAGAQLEPMTWTIEHLGPGSFATLPLLRMLGVSLAPLRWASVHHAFGSIEDLARVWSAALARLAIPAALVGVDHEDPRRASWLACPRGLVGRIVGVSTTEVTATAPPPGPLDWAPIFAS